MVALPIIISIMGINHLLFGQIAAISTTQISAGIVQGAKCANANAISFLSIPYTQAPTGELRFRAPQRFSDQFAGGSYNATKAAASCLQFGIDFLKNDPQSENW